ncbi:conserved hypothetical protein [uncultured Defluviicoccus sp.]|uniref:DUF4387 domain-containing protein n=1 Tax=metagenome TaxID=256318 RepID=A0A380T7P6_9ZZZZ|nr:conserved hypothetical protein [uncultured Defluviicoccus sp.]
MTTLREVCRHIRSKNAGPYWVTIDLFFKSAEMFARCIDSPAISNDVIGQIYGADPKLVRRYPVPSLNVLKISYPRASAQGGVVERDMHCGQQYVRLLDLIVD